MILNFCCIGAAPASQRTIGGWTEVPGVLADCCRGDGNPVINLIFKDNRARKNRYQVMVSDNIVPVLHSKA